MGSVVAARKVGRSISVLVVADIAVAGAVARSHGNTQGKLFMELDLCINNYAAAEIVVELEQDGQMESENNSGVTNETIPS